MQGTAGLLGDQGDRRAIECGAKGGSAFLRGADQPGGGLVQDQPALAAGPVDGRDRKAEAGSPAMVTGREM